MCALFNRFGVAFLLVVLACWDNQAQSLPLKVGAALVDITPPIGYPHYYAEAAGIRVPGSAIKNPLYGRALVFKQGNIKGALLVCDLNAIPKDIIIITREIGSKQTGIPFQHILIKSRLNCLNCLPN